VTVSSAIATLPVRPADPAAEAGPARVIVFPGSDPLPLPDPRQMARVPPALALTHHLLPVAAAGDATVVLTGRDRSPAEVRALTGIAGRLILRRVPPHRIEALVLDRFGPAMARAAERRVPAAFSCRGWSALSIQLVLLPLIVALVGVTLADPTAAYLGLVTASCVLLGLQTALRLAAAAATRRPLVRDSRCPDDLPVISIIVALYKEEAIAPRLVRRLARLDWPRDRLDVLIAVEADDTGTRAALARARLPAWMRVVVVPDGRPRTKPRALNHALTLARGSIVGIYDAEDTPAPDQLHRVAARFEAAPPQVACLQGVLAYTNTTTNWLARCFTIEYAAWFRVLLPGIERLGLPVPLGGTTLFFRREVLERLGAWDAHNVTEDADLGLRLARHGYRTEVIDTVTGEEANCRTLPWIKQRSRWIKGYAMTWAVHMRSPLRLWRDLGTWGFAGFQVLFLTTILHLLSGPVLLTLWLALLIPGHPLMDTLPAHLLWTLPAYLILCECVTVAICVLGLRRSTHRLAWPWVLTMHLYFPLAALAGLKALWELLARPFYWDKTAHGLHDGA
jgi:cellulose synthase/poly-beta-1,6-N-acetylglucosamine synthase-like glycosyltransferase